LDNLWCSSRRENDTGPWVRIVIKDRFDQTEATLVDTYNHPAGVDTVLWNGRGANYQKVPAGIYYIELQQLNGNDVYVQGRQVALKQ
jgi:flagellar hook assembly protein FlgD